MTLFSSGLRKRRAAIPMDNYGSFASYYDLLTADISYHDRCEYFDMLIRRHGGKKGILLDLACGTGSLSEEFARLGYDVIGVDSSEEMLQAAFEKKLESGLNIQYLCQDMTELDMFGTIDVTVCALDGLNHLSDTEKLRTAIEKVALFCERGGLFIFDVNTRYKHEHVLGNNTFVYDLPEVYCVWQNSFCEDDFSVDIMLDFFEPNSDGSYERYSEDFTEIAYSTELLDKLLVEAGFAVEAHYDFDSISPPREDSEKLIFVAKRTL